MKEGYRIATIDANKKASGRKLGVQVGRTCIKSEVSVAEASKMFGVSRQAIYNWFLGINDVPSTKRRHVEAVLAKIQNS